jgi:glycosyltransferase involved in cell wall biosynthesis
MRFSIIIPSYLGEYRNAAKDRERKIFRAIHSVLKQIFQDFEIIVVADGCTKTVELVEEIEDKRISCIYIGKAKLWSGIPRNVGIESAQGEYITYLDIDDLFGVNHLEKINEGLRSFDWVWFDDIRFNGEWYINTCDINKSGFNGTSNICHKRTLPYRWGGGYAHDYFFIKQLRQNKNFTKIEGPEYYVMHIPNSNIGKGYDL